MYLLRLIYSMLCWLLVCFAFFFHFLIAGIFSWVFPDRQWAHMRISVPFIRYLCALLGIRIKIMGKENLPTTGPIIFMSNHQSLFDILILLTVIPIKFSFIAKKQLLNIPFLGWDIRLQGHFSIDRENPIVAARKLETIKSKVSKGRSLLLFPEGTRSADGSIKPFKRGGFLIAQETGTPIIPIYINGAAKIIRKKTLMVTPGEVQVHIGTLISVSVSTDKTYTQELMDKTRNQIINFQQN